MQKPTTKPVVFVRDVRPPATTTTAKPAPKATSTTSVAPRVVSVRAHSK